jgi:plastocyanin
VFSVASRTSFTVAIVSLLAAFAAVLATHDRVTFAALVFAAAAAALAGVAVFLFTPIEPLVPPSAAVEASTVRTVDVTDLPRPSVWPVVAAAAITLVAVAAAFGRSIALLGIVASVVAGLGWLAQVWREHPSWTRDMSVRINDRFVVPIALPATIVVFAGVAVISLSRLLLASGEKVAPFIAIGAAFAVLGAFTLLSSRPGLGRPALVALVVVSSGLVVAAGIVGVMRGEREFEPAAGEASAHHTDAGVPGVGEPVALSADNLQFSKKDLRFPASAKVKVDFDNKDVAPHNFAVYRAKGGDALFNGDVVNGGTKASYDVGPLDAGSYYFQCDVHPAQMNGTLEVVVPAEKGTQPPSPGPGSTPTTVGP